MECLRRTNYSHSGHQKWSEYQHYSAAISNAASLVTFVPHVNGLVRLDSDGTLYRVTVQQQDRRARCYPLPNNLISSK